MSGYSYIKDPAAIYAESFARVRAAGQFGGMTPAMADVAVRLVHACGMPDLVADLAYSGRWLPALQDGFCRKIMKLL